MWKELYFWMYRDNTWFSPIRHLKPDRGSQQQCKEQRQQTESGKGRGKETPSLILSAQGPHLLLAQHPGLTLGSQSAMEYDPRDIVTRLPAFLWTRVKFSSVQSLSHFWLCDPMDCSTPGLPVHYQPLEFTQTRVHRVGDDTQPSHPLSSPSPPAFNLS